MDNRNYIEYTRRINKVQDYIEIHMNEQITLENLSTVAGFSKYHFSRIFQSIIHEPLAHYVNRIRMENSLFLLAHRDDKNMTDIAYEIGFSDSAVFSRAFKSYYGVSPTEYRQEYSKNCKDSFRLSEYNGYTAKREIQLDISKVNITLDTFKEKYAAYVRFTGSYEGLSNEYEQLVNTLFTAAMKRGLIVADNNDMLVIYHDNPEFGDDNQFRTSLCITVPSDVTFQEDETLGKMMIEGGLYAVGHFRIKAEEFPDAWDYMYREWLTRSGYVPRNASPFEMYLNDPADNEDHISTVDICVPVEPISF